MLVAEVSQEEELLTANDVTLAEDSLCGIYTLGDIYPHKDTMCSFKWDMTHNCLTYIESVQRGSVQRVVLQNYRDMSREVPLVRNFVRDTYRRVADTFEMRRY